MKSTGLGLASVLTIVFVVLKLIGAIAWSWWWVLSPVWISFGLWALVMGALGIVVLIATGADSRPRKRVRR